MKLRRYQALGNDYLVVQASVWAPWDRAAVTRRICDRHFGVGSDGILVRAGALAGVERLRILNADGSEAEKSGNGLRIFARFLFDEGAVGEAPFAVETLSGRVTCRVAERGTDVAVDMGRVSFEPAAIPLAHALEDGARGTIEVDGVVLEVQAASIGNPHCAVLVDRASEADARRFGPLLERHALFPRKTNVQFLEVVDRGRIRLEVWERGSGYTLSSGSCASAAAAVARKLGRVEERVVVEMRGGEARVEVSGDFDVTLRGAVSRVADLELAEEFLAELAALRS
jgi:diaminopimelate epimerase